MAITYPAAANNPIKRLGYMIRVIEKWKQLHNLMGLWYTAGLSQAQYDTLPLRVRNKLAYRPQLTKAQWDNAKGRLLIVRQGFMTEYQTRLKAIVDDVTFNPDPTDGAGTF